MPDYYELTSKSSLKKIDNYLEHFNHFFRTALNIHKSLPDSDIAVTPLPEYYVQRIYDLPERKLFYFDSVFHLLNSIPFKSKLEKIHTKHLHIASCPMLEIPLSRIKLSKNEKTITCRYGKIVSNLKFRKINTRSRFYLCKYPEDRIMFVVFSVD